jgi:hypothetical protein
MRLLRSHPPLQEATLRVQATKPRARFEVTTDGAGVVGHVGAALLADWLRLTAALSWRAGRGQTSRHRHDAGAVLRDLAVTLADGGHGRNAKLIFSAVLRCDASGAGLYLHPDHRRRLRRPPVLGPIGVEE